MKRSICKLAVLCMAFIALILVATACRGDGGNEAPPEVQPPPVTTPAPETPATTPEPGNDDSGIPAIMNPIGTLPIVNEPVTLSVFHGANPGIDFSTSPTSAWFEEQTGVTIDWIQVPQADLADRRNLMLATGDVPDILFSGVGTHATVFFYAQMGLFRPITNYIEPFAPELQRIFEQFPGIRNDMVMPDGNIYAFTAVDECFHCTMPQKLWIYTPWLDELGLPMPTTYQEFFDTMIAFRDYMPDILGVPHVYPFVGATGGRNGVDVLITPFIPSTEGSRLMVDNGNVTVSYNTDQFRDALRFLNRMFDENLIATETFVQDVASRRNMVENPGPPIVGSFPAMWIGGSTAVDIANQEGRWNGFRVVPPLAGPDGVATAVYVPLAGNNRAVITNNLPEELMPVAVRWLDNFYTETSALVSVQGTEGTHWRFAEPGEVGIHGGQALWARLHLLDAGQVDNVTFFQANPNFRDNNFRLGEVANRDIVEQETLLFDMTVIQEPFRMSRDRIMPVVIFDEAQSAEISDLSVSLNAHVNESIARFIVGDLDIESDWDWFIRELDVMGLGRFLQLQQQALNERNARLGS